ncbi:uncharacterized protein BYT42DRAFT_503094 [Radiomyces spectabilis]|uniref:uncharacterized protein n=1 Tax=Radiomyces spectabilis TaxID=64574 RepID=UPI00221F0840|nr:uncharacterized protein BYT42DRAFT_503094 [Radiomyces spectabilis]KAI8369601.1 hypothetical protein BYT42DRAFT_503094 [Radiomyces spectabilis]
MTLSKAEEPTLVGPSTDVVETDKKEEEYQDRFLEGSQRIIAYDLLEARGKANETTDPDVKRYSEAKELFRKGYDLCMSVPRTLDDDVLLKHEQDVKTAAETLVAAWMLDDKAAPMSERVLILGQQYEKVLLKDVPEDKREGFFVKESLLFSAWILLVGKQYQHCLSTLSLAIDTYKDLPVRIYFLRASCYFSLGKLRLGIKDMVECLRQDENFYVAYSVLGSVYMSLKERDNAIRNFKLYVTNGHPDTADYINACYSLSILLNQKKKAEARDFYNKAKEAEARFKSLYGTNTGMSETKREAVQLHEKPEDAHRMILEAMPAKHYNAKIEQLIKAGILQSAYPPNPKQCSNCGAANRKDKADGPLLCCGACKSIWYCSRDCQVADYKKAHKVACKKMVEAAQ